MKVIKKNLSLLVLLAFVAGLTLFFFQPKKSPTIVSPVTGDERILGTQSSGILTMDDLLAEEKQSTQDLTDKIKNQLDSFFSTYGPTATPTAAPTVRPKTPAVLKIAIVGDSMVQTMGDFSYLKEQLDKKLSPQIVELYNYGVGSANIDSAIERLQTGINEENRTLPSLTDLKPHIVILESFGYNPFNEELDPGRKHHYQSLEKTYDYILQNSQAKVYLMVTIAPNSQLFGLGPRGIDWPDQERKIQSQKIKAYLINALELGLLKHYRLIDCFTPSLETDGQGKADLISADDGIHPSVKGQKFISDEIVKNLAL